MEILVRFITCCGINMWIYLRIYLRSEMPNGKKRKKYERFCSILVSSSIVRGFTITCTISHIRCIPTPVCWVLSLLSASSLVVEGSNQGGTIATQPKEIIYNINIFLFMAKACYKQSKGATKHTPLVHSNNQRYNSILYYLWY